MPGAPEGEYSGPAVWAQEDVNDPRVGRFRAAFETSQFHLLEPVRPDVNYSFEVFPADPWNLGVVAYKWWLDERGGLQFVDQMLSNFDLERDEISDRSARELAHMEREELLRVYRERGLGAVLYTAGQMAVKNGELQEGDLVSELFRKGPEDLLLVEAGIGSGAVFSGEQWAYGQDASEVSDPGGIESSGLSMDL